MTKKKTSKEWTEYYIEYGIDVPNRKVMLDEDVDETSMGWIYRSIEKMVENDNEKPIELIINSYGGEVYAGLALYDLLEKIECQINTHAVGASMSMGLILFLAGDRRTAGERATFMAHSLAGGIEGKLSDMKIDVKEADRLNNILLDILTEKTKKSKKWWTTEIEHKDKYYSTKRAKQLGIINE